MNRLELGYTACKGNSSVYDKLNAIRNILNSTTKGQAESELKKVQKLLVDDLQTMAKDTGTSTAKEERKQQRQPGGLSEETLPHKDCLKAMIRVRKNDYSGQMEEKPSQVAVVNEQDATAAAMESMECHLAYLKLINVPSMFDVGAG